MYVQVVFRVRDQLTRIVSGPTYTTVHIVVAVVVVVVVLVWDYRRTILAESRPVRRR